MEWLNMCDAMLRLDGDSTGASEEEREANRMGMTVYNSVDDIPERCNKPAWRSISVEKIDLLFNMLIDIETPIVRYSEDALIMANRVVRNNAVIARQVRLILEGMDEWPDVDEIV